VGAYVHKSKSITDEYILAYNYEVNFLLAAKYYPYFFFPQEKVTKRTLSRTKFPTKFFTRLLKVPAASIRTEVADGIKELS
jgi:hypothetical protein